jgi:hypothetical protein
MKRVTWDTKITGSINERHASTSRPLHLTICRLLTRIFKVPMHFKKYGFLLS